jgi:hypothetical protein
MYYVYALVRPDGRPFYVGKGKNNRMYLHDTEARSGCKCHKCNVIRKIWRNGGKVVRYTLFTTEDEQEAFAYERETIALFGRENLCNHTDGGEGPSGRKQSVSEIRRRVASSRKTMSDPVRRARWREAILAYHQTSEAKERKSQSMRRYYRSDVGRKAASERSRQAMADPIKAARRLEALRIALQRPEYRAKKLAEMLARWADPEYKARVSASIKAAQNRPEAKAHRQALMQERYADPEERRKQGERAKKSHARPEVRERISQRTKEGLSQPGARAKLSKASAKRWQDPEYRARTRAVIEEANRTPEKRALFSEQQKAYRATPEGKAAAKRASRISAVKRAKLTRAQGKEIRALWDSGNYRQRDIAALYGVSQHMIWSVIHKGEDFIFKDSEV